MAPLAMEELVFRLLRSDAAATVRRAVVPDGNAGAIDSPAVPVLRSLRIGIR